MITLREPTPDHERLTPAATKAELRWFRQKQAKVFARTLLVTGGMGALYYVGTLLRDSHPRSHSFPVNVLLALAAFLEINLIVQAVHSVNLVRDVKARRVAMHDEQRKRIFLAALDDSAVERDEQTRG